jgi:hypothetical protein
VRLREHRHSLKEGLLEESKLAQHAYEEGHEVGWAEARILEVENNSRHRKYKESAKRSAHPILNFYPSGLVANMVTKLQGLSV